MKFDKKAPLVMNARRTVLGHSINRGTALQVVDKPKAHAEVDEKTAKMLVAKKLAVPKSEYRPTPVAEVEPEKEKSDLSPAERKNKSGGGKAPDRSASPAPSHAPAGSEAKKPDQVETD